MQKLTYKIIINKIIKWNFTNAPTIFTRKEAERKFTANFIWLLPLLSLKTQQLEIYLTIQKDPRHFKTETLLQKKIATITFKQTDFIYNLESDIPKFISFYKEPTYDQVLKFEIQRSNINQILLNQIKELHHLIKTFYQNYDTREITKPLSQKNTLTYRIKLQELYGESNIRIRVDNVLEKQYAIPKNKNYIPLFVVFNNYTIPSKKPWIADQTNPLSNLKRYSYLTSTPNNELAQQQQTETKKKILKNIRRKKRNQPASDLQIATIQKIFSDTYNKDLWFKTETLPTNITKNDAKMLLERILNQNRIGLTIRQHALLKKYFPESKIKDISKQTAFELIQKI
jgi:hypothetical protein